MGARRVSFDCVLTAVKSVRSKQKNNREGRHQGFEMVTILRPGRRIVPPFR